MSNNATDFNKWNPTILAVETVFQTFIMVICLNIDAFEISFKDKIAAYYTILVSIDTFCDIVTDMYLKDDTAVENSRDIKTVREENKGIHKFKLI